MIQRIADLLGPDLKKSDITLSLHLFRGTAKVNADRDLVEQVLINLIKNAIEATKEQEAGQINITTEKYAGNRVSISIADNGPGIADDLIEKIFIPFYTTRKNGTGIGLSFARQGMKLHNGDITVRKWADGGTVFIVTL